MADNINPATGEERSATQTKVIENADAPFSAFITNLGKYNEGELVGEWVPMPTTPEKLMQVFQSIDIDGKRYEEYFITDYETDIDGLYDRLPEYANLDEINYLAAKLDDMAGYELEKLSAILEHDGSYYGGSVKQIINLTENLDNFDHLPDVHNEEDLGYYYIEDAGIYDLKEMGNLANYIDYERFGRDVALDEGGTFTDKGYIRNTGDRFVEIHNGYDIPDEYRIMKLPEDEPDMVHGYEVKKSILFTNDRGFALAKCPTAPQPFVTWQLTENEDGTRDYYWGHYYADGDKAFADFYNRVDEYRKDYGLSEKTVEKQEPEAFKYYSTQRPVDIGTFPKEAGNAPTEIVNFDTRQPVENGAFHAWGYLMYQQPLTEKQMQDFELKPAPENYLKNAEMKVEQNFNQIDGIINNEPQPCADLTDGQTFEEIQELAPESLPEKTSDEKPSIKAMLKDCEKSATDAAPTLKPKTAELDLE